MDRRAIWEESNELCSNLKRCSGFLNNVQFSQDVRGDLSYIKDCKDRLDSHFSSLEKYLKDLSILSKDKPGMLEFLDSLTQRSVLLDEMLFELVQDYMSDKFRGRSVELINTKLKQLEDELDNTEMKLMEQYFVPSTFIGLHFNSKHLDEYTKKAVKSIFKKFNYSPIDIFIDSDSVHINPFVDMLSEDPRNRFICLVDKPVDLGKRGTSELLDRTYDFDFLNEDFTPYYSKINSKVYMLNHCNIFITDSLDDKNLRNFVSNNGQVYLINQNKVLRYAPNTNSGSCK